MDKNQIISIHIVIYFKVSVYMKFFKLFSLFGKASTNQRIESEVRRKILEQKKAKAIGPAAPGTKIYYHEGLVDKLEDDHQGLLELYSEILEAFDKKDIKTVRRLLIKFRSKINDHFLLENIKLYIYLKNVLKKDKENYRIMLLFQKEISQIGMVVSKFLDKYISCEWTAENSKTFGIEIEQIGDALVTRIRKEEEVLYPLYMPPEAY